MNDAAGSSSSHTSSLTSPLTSPLASLLSSLGTRSRRRPEPRLSITLAGAGSALAVLGVLVVSGDTGAGDESFNSIPGLVLSVLVVVAGLVTLQQAEDGALAAAGAAAASLGVPATMFFLTYDSGSLPPYSSDAILVVSTIAWLVAYGAGPTRGRSIFLGAGLIGVWFTLLQVTEQVFDAPFGFLGFGFARSFESTGSNGGYQSSSSMLGPRSFGGGFHGPDPTVLGLLSLAVGVAYVVATRWLDRRSHTGAATPFAAVAIAPLVAGTLFLSDDLDQAGTGLLLAVLGVWLARHGSTTRRRATAWIGGVLCAIGLATIVIDLTDDATIGGLLLAVAGLAMVAGGYGLGRTLGEPPEFTDTDGIAPMRPSNGGPSGAVSAEPLAAPTPPVAPVAAPALPRRDPANVPPAKKTVTKKTVTKKAVPKKAAPRRRQPPPPT
jgi:hypothetical protein